ncbi:MAG: hypothetical protein ABIR94_00950 [Rubrivivax sp.]
MNKLNTLISFQSTDALPVRTGEAGDQSAHDAASSASAPAAGREMNGPALVVVANRFSADSGRLRQSFDRQPVQWRHRPVIVSHRLLAISKVCTSPRCSIDLDQRREPLST